MSCREHEEQIVDVARGVAGDLEVAALLRHVEGCEACARRLRRERALTARLRSLDEETPGEGPSPRVEAALVAAFEERRRAIAGGRMAAAAGGDGRMAGIAWRPWMAVAATLALAVAASTVAWRVARQPDAALAAPIQARPVEGIQAYQAVAPVVRGADVSAVVPGWQRETRVSARAATPAGDAPAPFVPWPGAAALPAFESGELVRTELPVSVLPLLGIDATLEPESETVVVDVVVGQDGFARAVRLAK